MMKRTFAAILLFAAFSLPSLSNAAAANPKVPTVQAKKKIPKHNGVTNKSPGAPGYTGSSPLGSAERKARKKAKRASRNV
jgi:hypothetical protein